MPLQIKIIWLAASIAILILNSALPYSLFVGFANLIPLTITGYVIIHYYKELRWNTPWGIPYFILIFLNVRSFENTISKTALYAGLSGRNELILKGLLVCLATLLLITAVIRRQRSLPKS